MGTRHGSVLTFKILPSRNGTFSVAYAGITPSADPVPTPILSIQPINTTNGSPASASPAAVSGLHQGHFVTGTLVVVTASSVRVFRPPTSRGAHKSFDDVLCYSAAVSQYEGQGRAVVGLFGDGSVRAFSLPGLKELGVIHNVGSKLDARQFSSAIVTSTGDILAPTGPSEIAVLNVWGTGVEPWTTGDSLYNPEAKIPTRPTISNLQWIAGTQYVTPADMDLLIGGPDRPPSKRMLAEMRAAAETDRQAARRQGSASSNDPQFKRPARTGTQSLREQQQNPENESYWAYMQRQVQERTERLGIAGDSMTSAQESSQGWADDVNKFVSKQKRNMVMGALGSKFGI